MNLEINYTYKLNMEQLTQKFGNGEMVIQELPIPQLGVGMVLVKNHYSLISTGTEGTAVKDARKNIITKVKERPQQVKQVFESLQKNGLIQTFRTVMKKMEGYSPLGYSCAGEVMDVSEGINEFKIGDLIACAGGGYASHAEVVTVPANLCVKLNSDADLSKACYNTLGAIALQGVRQADLHLGESCAVIGLGLIGQLVCLQLKASGVRVVGIDINESKVKTASEHCADLSLTRNSVNIDVRILDFTNGIGVDAVIITAASSSLDPINFAGLIARKRGTVVVLGAVPTGFDRGNYYNKELQLRMSCSYGPGRYDLNYEENGIDYPVAYVRWTEKRNMEAFQKLLSDGIINISYLTTHKFPFEKSLDAYELVLKGTEQYLGIVLEYDIKKNHTREKLVINYIEKAGLINLAFIGAGNYAQAMLLPNIPNANDIVKVGILTNTGTSSKRIAEKYGFSFCTSDENDIMDNKDINTLFIATRHDSHAMYVIDGLNGGKNVYVEKPLCLNVEELERIKALCIAKNKSVMVGFNRRFSPHAQMIKRRISNGKISMIYRINAGYVPADSWIQNLQVGGGRIIGEVCHFIDLMTYMCGCLPIKVTASALPDSQNLNDTINIIVDFENGSSGIIAYYSNGSKQLPKEYFEVYSSGITAIIHDFKKCEIYGKDKIEKSKLYKQDKGQKSMMEMFLNGLKNANSPIPIEQIFAVTLATFAVIKSIRGNGVPVLIK